VLLEKTLYTFMTGPSVSLYHKQLDPKLQEDITTLWLSPLSSLLIISSYRRTGNVICFLFCQ